MPCCRSLYLTVAGHEIHLTEWGDPAAPALVMWHGLARTGADFDTAARHFSDHLRVICPDTIGRGLSGWSADPERDYTLASYVAHAVELLERLEIERCRWVGTSLGGLVGMVAAAGPLRGRIERLVLNDVGPVVNPVALERIKAYVTRMPDFPTLMELEAFVRVVYAPFGSLTDDEWRRLAETSARRRDDGRWTLHYDPRVMTVLAARMDEEPVDLWPVYDAVDCPTLVLRGAESDLLTAETAQAMTRRGPKAHLVTVPGCGHAPALNVVGQLAELDAFLR